MHSHASCALALQGFAFTHKARVLTVFSAPNYCYRCGNTAATLEVSDTGALQSGRALEAVARGALRLQQFDQPLVFNAVPPNLPSTSSMRSVNDWCGAGFQFILLLI